MKGLQRIILLLSLSILMGHSIVPHSHCSSGSYKVIESADAGLLDFLEDMLALNIGNHHLEDYETPEEFSCRDNNTTVIYTVLFYPIHFLLYNPELLEQDNCQQHGIVLVDSCTTQPLSLRGSPLFC